jgi:hypothetical protein
MKTYGELAKSDTFLVFDIASGTNIATKVTAALHAEGIVNLAVQFPGREGATFLGRFPADREIKTY